MGLDMAERFVTYLRVSTRRQGESGLGVEAQRAACEAFIRARGGELPPVSEFCEIETGKADDRPQLRAAIDHARATGATLLIAKLDRLSRNAAFLMNLRDAGVRFVAADMPDANALTVGIMALMAQHEREAISERTKAALQAAKARGVRLGGDRGGRASAEAQRRGAERNAEAAEAYARRVARYVLEARQSGAQSLRAIGQHLEAAGVQTRRGGTSWSPSAVKAMVARIEATA